MKKTIKKVVAKATKKKAVKKAAVTKPHNWRQLARDKKAKAEREKLEKRLAKRGSYKGSPH